MAAVTTKRTLRILSIVAFSAAVLGCPIADLPLKTAIKSLAAPGNVGGMKVISYGNKQFKVTWQDPSDPDVDHIEISLRAPLTSDTPPAPVNVPLGQQSAIVNVPFNNVQYIVVVKAVDKAGNKSPGTIYTPLSIQTAFNSALSLTNTLLLPSTHANPSVKLGYNSYPLSSATSEATYTYVNGGTSGAIKTETDYAPLGTQTDYWNYQYDFRGNLTRKDHDYSSTPYLSEYWTYQYDGAGNQTGSAYYNGGTSSTAPTLSSSDSFQYDANGNLIGDNQYDGTGTLQDYITYQNDSFGRLVSGTEYNSTGAAQYVISIQWDPTSGFPSLMTIKDPSGNVFLSSQYVISGTTLAANVYINLFGASSFTVTSTFDTHGLLRSISANYSGGTQSVNYTPDADGNTTTEVDNFGAGNTPSGGDTWTY